MPIPDQLRSHIDSSGVISKLPAKYSKKTQLAMGLLQELELNRQYSEGELKEIFSKYVVDHAFIRRALVDAGVLVRDKYGKQYQRLETEPDFDPASNL